MDSVPPRDESKSVESEILPRECVLCQRWCADVFSGRMSADHAPRPIVAHLISCASCHTFGEELRKKALEKPVAMRSVEGKPLPSRHPRHTRKDILKEWKYQRYVVDRGDRPKVSSKHLKIIK